MPGRPRKRAAIAELTRLAHEEIGEDATPLDWVELQVASGMTLAAIGRMMTHTLGVQISGEIVRRAIAGDTPEAGEVADKALTRARARGAHQLVEQAMLRAEDVDEDRDAIAKAKLQNDLATWLAARWNRTELGEQKGPLVQLNVQTLHLDALRTITAAVRLHNEPDHASLCSGEEVVDVQVDAV